MFKRELKVNLKGFIWWTSIIVGLLLIVYLIYPSIASNENIKMLDEMIALFPEEIIKMFNMDIASISTAFGWLKSEGFVFIILIFGAYSAILGSSILSKEENDKTIEYLNSLPIKRSSIVINKVLVSLMYIVSIILITLVFNYICLFITGDFNTKELILLSIAPIFSSVVLFFICLFISTIIKSKKTITVAIGLTFISYIIHTLSGLSESVEFLKYLSVFTLADVRNVIISSSINPIMIIISIIISIVLFITTICVYNKKELI